MWPESIWSRIVEIFIGLSLPVQWRPGPTEQSIVFRPPSPLVEYTRPSNRLGSGISSMMSSSRVMEEDFSVCGPVRAAKNLGADCHRESGARWRGKPATTWLSGSLHEPAVMSVLSLMCRDRGSPRCFVFWKYRLGDSIGRDLDCSSGAPAPRGGIENRRLLGRRDDHAWVLNFPFFRHIL